MKAVSISFYLIGRFTPYEWIEPNECCHSDKSLLENKFTLAGSFWLTFEGLLKKG